MTTETAETQLSPLPTIQEEGDRPLTMLALIARAATDPTVDVTKMRALLDMQRELVADQARQQFSEAMNRAQREIQPVARTAENTQTRSLYAKLEDVDKAIRPIYLDHGFALSYNTVAPLTPGHIRIECRCSHVGGHTELFYREAAADTLGPKGSAVKTALHGGASTETFLKRYLACGIFNVVFKNLDDDGVRGGRDPIGIDEIKELTELIAETGTNLESFCRWMNVEALADIDKEVLFPVAKHALMARKAQQKRTTGDGN